jgi:hypothetical protein
LGSNYVTILTSSLTVGERRRAGTCAGNGMRKQHKHCMLPIDVLNEQLVAKEDEQAHVLAMG